VQLEDGVQAVEQAAEVGGVGFIGSAGPDLLDEPTEPGDLVGDLGVGPAHRRRRVNAAEQPVQRRVQLGLLGTLVRPDLAGQLVVDPADPGHRPGSVQGVGRNTQFLDIGPDGLMLGTEPPG